MQYMVVSVISGSISHIFDIKLIYLTYRLMDYMVCGIKPCEIGLVLCQSYLFLALLYIIYRKRRSLFFIKVPQYHRQNMRVLGVKSTECLNILILVLWRIGQVFTGFNPFYTHRCNAIRRPLNFISITHISFY